MFAFHATAYGLVPKSSDPGSFGLTIQPKKDTPKGKNVLEARLFGLGSDLGPFWVPC